ncbi:hypothetical protein ACFL5U_02090 [Candidatus Margulisiibacteriota bacterium]
MKKTLLLLALGSILIFGFITLYIGCGQTIPVTTTTAVSTSTTTSTIATTSTTTTTTTSTSTSTTTTSTTTTTERPFESLGYPFSTPADVIGLSSFGIPNWSGSDPHNGIDLVIDHTTLVNSEIISPTDGSIRSITVSENPFATPPTWLITVAITVNSTWQIDLVLEPDTSIEATATAQQNAIVVSEGAEVSTGDKIADLLVGEDDYVHLHYIAYQDDTAVCAYKFSTDAAKALFLDVVANGTNNNIPDGNISYGDPD